jgi:phosphoglycolate phosphatase-like HAD superfamily hydrolase
VDLSYYPLAVSGASRNREVFDILKHLIWDWNGTLLDEENLVLAATNEAFARLHFPEIEDTDPAEIAPGIPALTPERYREVFTRPLRKFYYAVMRRNITDSEFQHWTELYFAAHVRRSAQARLNSGARAALQAWHKAGGSQSLLSMSEHSDLIQQVQRLGLASYFVRIDGRRHAHVDGNDSKRDLLRSHLKCLLDCGSPQISAAIASGGVVMVGDMVGDIVAARAVGVTCILFTKGSPGLGQAEITNVSKAATLRQAVELAKTSSPR